MPQILGMLTIGMGASVLPECLQNSYKGLILLSHRGGGENFLQLMGRIKTEPKPPFHVYIYM